MHCLAENAAMMQIARRAGMDVVVDMGEVDAHLELPPASPASIAGEFVTDRLALYDYALKANVAAWRGVNGGARGSGRGGDAGARLSVGAGLPHRNARDGGARYDRRGIR